MSAVNLMSIRAVCDRTGLCRTTIYKLLSSGGIPKPTYPVPRTPRWRSDEIDEWIEKLSAER